MKQTSQDILAAVIARDVLRKRYSEASVVMRHTAEFLDLFHEYQSSPKKITSYFIANPGLRLD